MVRVLSAVVCVLDRSLDGPCAPPGEGWGRRLVVDAFVGARYYRTDVSLTFTGPLGRPRDVSGTDERVDPFVGGRVAWNPGRRWVLAVRGDVGGFGIGDAAEFTWQVSATLGYRLTRSLSLALGWRVLAADTVTGSGADRSGQDLVQSGPLIGLGIDF